MNGVDAIVAIANILVKIIPQPQPPRPDYKSLYEIMKIDTSKLPTLPEMTMIEQPVLAPAIRQTITPSGTAVATSCIACSRSHMATIAGALDESIRFAREGGITDPEALSRIDAAEKEVNIMERIDLSPEAIQNSPEQDKEMARYFLPKIRGLRQQIGQISSVDALEKAAAEASTLTHEFRLKQMQMNGADLNPILTLAKKVQSGEMTMEQARAEARKYMPQGA